MKNKLKLSLIVIATLVAGNVNAQTYYSCIPEGCSSGQYFDGVKCMRLCPTGYLWDADKVGCYKEYCNISFSKYTKLSDRTGPTVKSNTGITASHIGMSRLNFFQNKHDYSATIPYKDCINGICCDTRL